MAGAATNDTASPHLRQSPADRLPAGKRDHLKPYPDFRRWMDTRPIPAPADESDDLVK